MQGHPTPVIASHSAQLAAGETAIRRDAGRGFGVQPFYMPIVWDVGHTLYPQAGITHVLLNMADEAKSSA